MDDNKLQFTNNLKLAIECLFYRIGLECKEAIEKQLFSLDIHVIDDMIYNIFHYTIYL